MARFVLFLILLVPLTIAGNWLMGNPGMIRIDWLGYEIEMHIALAVIALVVVCIAAVLLALALWQLATWPDRRRAKRRYRTLSRGLQHLTQGMTSLALGHESAAETALKKARATLPGEPLPKLLTAQLLQRQGKQEEARGEFRALLAYKSTAQLATHRLIEQHLVRREWAEAAAQAEDARRDAPRDRWLALTLIDLYTRLGNTAGMKSLTEGWHFHSPLTKAERHRYAAIAYLLSGQRETTPRGRLTAARHAYHYAPDFLPAALAYADALTAEQDFKAARKVLLANWLREPVPAIINPLMQALGPANARQQRRLIQPFLKNESAARYLLEAQQAFEESDFPRMKQAAETALSFEESKQGCAYMAEAEKEISGAEASSVWLARAMDAPRPPGWICQRCGTGHAAWQPHCNGCDTFDSLAYERPEARITSIDLPATAAGSHTAIHP